MTASGEALFFGERHCRLLSSIPPDVCPFLAGDSGSFATQLGFVVAENSSVPSFADRAAIHGWVHDEQVTCL